MDTSDVRRLALASGLRRRLDQHPAVTREVPTLLLILGEQARVAFRIAPVALPPARHARRWQPASGPHRARRRRQRAPARSRRARGLRLSGFAWPEPWRKRRPAICSVVRLASWSFRVIARRTSAPRGVGAAAAPCSPLGLDAWSPRLRSDRARTLALSRPHAAAFGRTSARSPVGRPLRAGSPRLWSQLARARRRVRRVRRRRVAAR